MDRESKKISDYMNEIGDDYNLINDYVVINGKVKLFDQCSDSELYPDEDDGY